MWGKSELKIIKIIITHIISVLSDSSTCVTVTVTEPESEEHEDIIIEEKRF
jgi:hypothetical protein